MKTFSSLKHLGPVATFPGDLVEAKSCCLPVCGKFAWLLILLAELGGFSLNSSFGADKKNKGKESDSNLDLPALVIEKFSKWDLDRNGSLNTKELVALVESPKIEGKEAAVLVTLLKNMDKNDHLARAALLDKVEKQTDFVQKVRKNYHAIQSCTKELFARPEEPTLEGAKQELGDCYLAAPIAALVNRNPAAVRAMFSPQKDGTLLIRWGSGRVDQIYPPTDGEMVLMEKVNQKHGRWHAALEKAYSHVNESRQEKKAGKVLDFERTVNDLIGHGGHAIQTMEVIASTQVRSETHMAKDPVIKIHTMLSIINDRKLLAVVHSKMSKTPGIQGSHVNAVLGYDAGKQLVHVFNQNGVYFKPIGEEGLQNGYLTKNGHFYVPVADFVKVWGMLTYETGQPKNAPSPNNSNGKNNKKGNGKG